MTLDTFFKKFDQFAEAPDAVAKMRELVLQLAVQGKLVSQNPKDQPAEKLLAAIKNERQQAAIKNGARAQQTLQPISSDELPYELPPGWEWERLGNIGDTNIGLTYSPQDVGEKGVPVMRSSNLQKGKIDLSDLVRVAIEPKSNVMVEVGDLLICARNGSRALVGKTALIGSLAEKTAFGAFMAIFRSSMNQYLYHFICSPLFRKVIAEVNTTTINQITQGNLRSTLAPIPPLAEQKRIVAKVDELMALCDRLEAQQQERDEQASALARASLARFAEAPTPANLNLLFHKFYSITPADLRKSILTLAVQGKLVKQDPKQGKTTAVTMEELVGRKNLKNGLSLSPTADPTDFVCLPLSAVNGSNLDCSYGKPIAISAERAAPYLIESGDIFIMRGNGSKERVGIAAMARTTPANVLFPDLLIRIPLPRARIDGEYFLIAWNNPTTRKTVEALAATTAGIWKINQGHISECSIPLPPLAEQLRIVTKVNQLMALVEQLETQLATTRSTAKDLLEVLVTGLTAQRPPCLQKGNSSPVMSSH